MREMIFSNVDFPAPLAPIIAMVSPCLSSKEMSFSAQKSPFSSGSATVGVIAGVGLAPPSLHPPAVNIPKKLHAAYLAETIAFGDVLN